MVKFVWIFNTETGGEVELRVKVHGKDALSQFREGMGKIADRARFCNAPFLICDHNDFAHFSKPPSYFHFQLFAIFGIISTHNIVNYVRFWNKIGITNHKMLNTIGTYQFSCCTFGNTAEHFSELANRDQIGI